MGKKSKKKNKKKKETLDNIKPHKKLSSYFYREYLERAHLNGIIVDSILIEHPVYDKHPALRKKVDQILMECADVYQLVGYLTYKKELIEEKAEKQRVKKK